MLTIMPLAASSAPVNHRNVTFTDPWWTMRYLGSERITMLVNDMRGIKIKYQMIDLGFFDRDLTQARPQWHPVIDGSMDDIHTRYLRRWLDYSRRLAPEMKFLGVINGNTNLHVLGTRFQGMTPAVSQAQMHENIAAHSRYLINTYGLDGIVLDFEPLTRASTAAYVRLVEAVRNKIGEDKLIVICASIDPAYLDSATISAYRDKVDIFLSMNYDTGLAAEAEYIKHVSDSVLLISDVFKNSSTRVVPLGPGVYAYNQYHTAAENARTHSLAVIDAIARGAEIYASGLWWFAGARQQPRTGYYDFLTYWVNQTISPPRLTFTHSPAFNIPASTVGTAIASIDVSDGVTGGTPPYTFTAAGLPAGIAISAAGVIFGTPTTPAAAATAVITVTDSAAPGVTDSITIDVANVTPLRDSQPGDGGCNAAAGLLGMLFVLPLLICGGATERRSYFC